MPSEQPNENMDKVLKGYAQKRRDESDPIQLDRATRNMLQAEVARQLGKVPVAAQTQTARPRFAWWPQIIMGVACTAALALAVLFWRLPDFSSAKEKRSMAVADATVPNSEMQPSVSFARKGEPEPVAAPATASAPIASAKPAQESLSKQVETTKAAPEPAPAPSIATRSEAKSAPASTTYNFDATLDVGKNISADKSVETPAPATLGVGQSDSGGHGKLAASKDLSDVPATPFYANSDSFKGKLELNDEKMQGRNDIVFNSAGTSSLVINGVTDGVSTANASPADVPAATIDFAKNSAVSGGEYKSFAWTAPHSLITTNAAPSNSQLAMVAQQPAKKAQSQLAAAPAANIQQQRVRFSQVNNRAQYRDNLNSPPLPKVLTNFGLERNGPNVTVRDADGSIYNGRVIEQKNVQTISGTGGSVSNNLAQDNYAFRVSGYNNSVRAKIVFSGNITNAISNNLNFVTNQNNFSRQQNFQNILLNGRVQIGKNTEFDIEAEPTTK